MLDETNIKVGGMFKSILVCYFNFSFRDVVKGMSKASNKGDHEGG